MKRIFEGDRISLDHALPAQSGRGCFSMLLTFSIYLQYLLHDPLNELAPLWSPHASDVESVVPLQGFS